MKTTAHRGVSSLAPENTLVAFQLAAQQGVEWIEIDVQLSADKVPVVIHDQTVNRCTDGSGKVADLSLKKLQELDAGLWFGEQYRNERIPSLSETLCFVQQHDISLNIELKVYSGDDIELLCQQIAAVVAEVGVSYEQLLFSSFNTQALMEMKAKIPSIRRGQLWQSIPENALSVLNELEAFSVHCDYRFLTEKLAKHVKTAGYQLYCYTPNFPELVEAHWKWGVDMMITDEPHSYLMQAKTVFS
ncbi:glycerophosphoryl diester phosphodiesterase [Vibrio mediterranei]